MIASVVVPTFNRGRLLVDTVDHVLRNRLPEGAALEIIVVDDGSRVPAASVLSAVVAEPPFSLRVLCQENAGPASARNAGFRAARGSVVLFLDDDILARPDLVARHLEAHRLFPRSVIFGFCPFSAEADTPLLRYMNGLARPSETRLTRVERVASGHLSVERAQFADAGGLYREDLRTPAAEEFELSYRLRTSGIPILFAPEIVGLHFQPVELPGLCTQQYKYGVGLAEAAVKCGDLRDMPELQTILDANQALRRGDPPGVAARKILKSFLGRPGIRPWADRGVRVLERFLGGGSLLEGAYRLLLGASFYAGLQEGRRLYSPS